MKKNIILVAPEIGTIAAQVNQMCLTVLQQNNIYVNNEVLYKLEFNILRCWDNLFFGC